MLKSRSLLLSQAHREFHNMLLPENRVLTNALSLGRSHVSRTIASLVVVAARTKDAKKYITKYRRLDLAVDAFYNSPPTPAPQASTSKLNALFDKYKGTSSVIATSA